MSRRADQTPVGDEVYRQDTCFRIERSGHTEQKLFVAGLNGASWDNDVLRLEGRDQSCAVDTETRKLFGREFNKDPFVLRTEHIDF